jgi:hypothetical protein
MQRESTPLNGGREQGERQYQRRNPELSLHGFYGYKLMEAGEDGVCWSWGSVALKWS